MNYRRFNTLILHALTAGVLLLQVGGSLASPVFKSANARFVKFAVTQNGSKVMLVAFNESKGKGKGYDTLYADTNFDGRLLVSERVGLPNDSPSREYMMFPKVQVSTRFNANAKGASVPTEFSFLYTNLQDKPDSLVRTEHFNATVTFQLIQGNVPFNYNLTADINPSYTMQKAPLIDFSGVPAIKAEIKPAASKEEATGISLALMAGKWKLSTPSGEGRITTAVAIRDANGKRIDSRIGDLEDFGFG